MQVSLIKNSTTNYIDKKNIERIDNTRQSMPHVSPSIETLQAYNNISFKQRLSDIFPTIDEYKGLNYKELEEIRNTADTILENNPTLSTEEGLYLVETIANQITDKYKNHRIISLGRSPLPMLEMAKMMKNGIDDYTFIAFSEGSIIEEARPTGEWWHPIPEEKPTKKWLLSKQVFRPTDEQYNNYRNYLKKNQMDPRSIIERAEYGEKTILIDFIYSGGGTRAFLEILRNWSLEQNNYDELKKSIITVPLYYSDNKKSQNAFTEERIYPTNDESETAELNIFKEFNAEPIDLLNFDNEGLYCNVANKKSSFAFEQKYSYFDWTNSNGPKRGPEEGYELKAELAKFNIIDYLARNELLK